MLGNKSLLITAMQDSIDDADASHRREIDKLQQRLHDAQRTAVFRDAAKQALGTLVDEMVDEVKGKKPVRLSDPANRDLRNAFYVDTMAGNVKVLADGRARAPDGTKIEMTPETIAEFKAKRQLK
ncbi:hypothetical protein [Hydrogenophaga sp. 2FB]|uniref:hypothetical protein n=1 Tax=Hydrogenophaga sp. 2FB TaxID=2502187 RepID=UPI0010F62A8E|nr:hypothetical protein [Hydrogenophaga sp. 2FB]